MRWKFFEILFQTGYVNIFVLCGAFFSRYVQLKSSFSDIKNVSDEIWDTLVEMLSKIIVAKY